MKANFDNISKEKKLLLSIKSKLNNGKYWCL
jgi:hypothetical protein